MAQPDPHIDPSVAQLDPESRLLSFIAQFTARTGIEVGTRRGAFIRCLDERAIELGFPTLGHYLAQVEQPGPAEIGVLVRSLLLGYTWFFRDLDQLQLLMELLEARSPSAHQPSIWIAGCATGEEAYSVAMMLVASQSQNPPYILASDIDEQSLAYARAGRYPAGCLRLIPQQYRGLVYVAHGHGGTVQMSGELQRRVRFVAHNLMLPAPQLPSGAGWDVISCRNVLMHLAQEQRATALRVLARALAPGGCLLVGASEYLHDQEWQEGPERLERCERGGRFFLRRPPRPAASSTSPRLPSVDSNAEELEAPEEKVQIRSAPYSVTSELQRAAADIQRGRMDAALPALRAVLERLPLCSEALLLLGIAHHLIGADEAAVLVLQQALFVRPELWLAAFYLGQSLERLGQPEAAGCAYRWVERESARPLPDEASLLALLGMASWRQELLQSARQRAQALQPPHSEGPIDGPRAAQKNLVTLGDSNAEPSQDKNPSRG